MNPDQVRAVLPLTAEPPPTAHADAVLAQISASYFRLRCGMAVLAIAFPLVLWIGGGVGHLQASISDYYHYHGGRLRDVFVGVLWALGAFLFFYRGYSRGEDRALNLAGVAAVVIALFPDDYPASAPATWIGRLHGAAAIGFFLLIAYVCVFRSGDTLAVLADVARRHAFLRTYRVLGLLMVALPLSVTALRFAWPGLRVATFLMEVAGIWTFAAFWLVKSREIALIERQ